MQRFEDRLARLEALRHEMPARWQIFHLHNALNALPHDHSTADLHLDEFDRHELAKEYPELEADKVPTVDEIRTRFELACGRDALMLGARHSSGASWSSGPPASSRPHGREPARCRRSERA